MSVGVRGEEKKKIDKARKGDDLETGEKRKQIQL